MSRRAGGLNYLMPLGRSILPLYGCGASVECKQCAHPVSRAQVPSADRSARRKRNRNELGAPAEQGHAQLTSTVVARDGPEMIPHVQSEGDHIQKQQRKKSRKERRKEGAPKKKRDTATATATSSAASSRTTTA
jgi:hypothetical protein